MIKFESYLAINDNNIKNNTGSYNKKLGYFYAYSPDLKKAHLNCWLLHFSKVNHQIHANLLSW